MRRRIGVACFLGVGLVAGAVSANPLAVTPREADRTRIRRHLAQVERVLRVADTSALTPAQKTARAQHIDNLHTYWVRGEFPENTDHPGQRVPTFIDERGTACAAGHLMITSGAEPLAQDIDQRFHNDYVKDMHGQDLVAWVQSSGLSVAEVALIQPTYCSCGYSGPYLDGGGEPQVPDGGGPQAYQPVCGADGLTYWNRCAAEMCGEAVVAYDGECILDGGVCTTAQFGNNIPVIDVCVEAYGQVCDKTGGAGKQTTDDYTARAWLQEQKNHCADAAVGTGGTAGSGTGGITGVGGSGGSNLDAGVSGAGASDGGVRPASSDDGGCSTTPRRGSPRDGLVALFFGLLAITVRVGRRRRVGRN